MPPAMRKAWSVIPSALKTSFPTKNAVTRISTTAVAATRAMRRLSAADRRPVRVTKTGIFPNGLVIATSPAKSWAYSGRSSVDHDAWWEG